MIQKRLFLSVLMLLTLSTGLASAAPNTELQSLSLEFIHDKQGNLSIDDVINKKIQPIPNQHSLGVNFDTVWYKVTITGSTQKTQFYLHNKLAYLSEQINIYELIDKRQIVKTSYDFLESNIANKLTGSTLVYPFSISPNKTKIIFIKNKALVHQLIDIDIYQEQQSIQALINKNFFSNFIISCLFALALYNAMMFFYNKRREFLIYAFYLLNAAVGLSYLYGTVFHNFNIYGHKVYWLNITAILVSLFLALFVQAVFETHRNSRRLHFIFNAVITVAFIDLVIAIFIDLPFAIDVVGIIFLCSFFAICYLAVHFYKKKHPLIKIFVLAYSFYVAGIIIILSCLMGFIPYNAFTFHASGMGILIEAVLFSYLLNFRMILLEKKVIKLVDVKKNLEFIADHDHLTNILNRRAFMNQAEAAISLAKRYNEPLSFIMIDLDLFKKVNDKYGHHTGDVVLTLFSETVSNLIRNEDIFGRIGGEEFSIIVPRLTKQKAFIVAEKLRKAIANKDISTESYQFQQTISIGLSTLTSNDKTLFDIQKRADEALYEAKSNGRNQVVFK